MGIKNTITYDNGKTFNINNNNINRIQNHIKKLQSILSRKTRDSINYNKILYHERKLHKRINNIKNDLMNKEIHNLVMNYNVICIEDLSINNMIIHNEDNKKSHNINKSIYNNNISMFINKLYNSCNKYNIKLITCNKYYPSTQLCNNCGYINTELRNNLNTREWICLLSTDTAMDENEIIRQYGKRWNIEVLFKSSKQYLKFGKDFQSPSFEAQNAQIAIAFSRYILIALEQRESKDYRSCGELFMFFCQELQDISFIQSLALVISLLKEGMMKLLGISEKQIQAVVDYVIAALPGYLRRTLIIANNQTQVA